MNYNINYNNPNSKVFSIYDSVVVYPVWTSSMIFDAGEGENSEFTILETEEPVFFFPDFWF